MKKPKTIPLSPQILQAVTERQRIISQQQHLLSSLQLELQYFLAKATGADVLGEDWEVDMQSGLLYRRDLLP